MATDTICPICGFQGIAAEKEKCPQCDADLACFRVLDSLPDALTLKEAEPVPRHRFPAGAGITLFLFVVVGFFLVWMFRGEQGNFPVSYGPVYPVSVRIDMEAELERRARQRPAEPAAEVSVLPTALMDESVTKKGFEGVEKDLPAEEKKQVAEESGENAEKEKDPRQENGFWMYHTPGDETLWRIARTYYGTGYYYPVLLKHNPGLGIYDLRKDLEIRILKDPRQAEQVYKEITALNGSRVCYLYVVEEGDTLKSIARRFYGTEAMVERIHRLNPDAAGKPGEVIRIELE